jgi:hypothetical protein
MISHFSAQDIDLLAGSLTNPNRFLHSSQKAPDQLNPNPN